ncbi:Glucose dehydrogenase [FAD, quinone] [Gryllus bimaculatus]|nr:Glucose dehydrogenase [FAD, quinone] [Gryllus bimaculatus]
MEGRGGGRRRRAALWRAGRAAGSAGRAPDARPHRLGTRAAFGAPSSWAWKRSRCPRRSRPRPDADAAAFDFVVVGGGAAGCVLANRLSEVPHWRVLLLEAGGEEAPIMDVPFIVGAFHDTNVNWRYRTVPQRHMCTRLRGRTCDYQQGRALGGSTVIDHMLSVRGNARDFDAWAAEGNAGWDFESLLPYFRKVERMQIPELRDSPFHGARGHVRVNYSPYQSDMSKALIRAYEEAGAQQVDYNGASQVGVSRSQTTTANGGRWSAARGYLRPARARSNLVVRPRSTATRLLFDDDDDAPRVVGVQYVHHGVLREARATKEVRTPPTPGDLLAPREYQQVAPHPPSGDRQLDQV